MMPIESANSIATTLESAQPDFMMLVGTLNGKGIVSKWTITAAGTDIAAVAISFTDNASSGNVLLNAPSGGMHQFKGLTQGTTEDKYVTVRCIGVQPMYWTDAYKNLATADTNNGFMINCLTGISNCTMSNIDVLLTAAETVACLKDPRYLTWRLMTVKIEYDGTLIWYRTDSYWDQSSFVAASTWGTAIQMSANAYTNVDNSGTTDVGKQYVYPMMDGSGISLNHLTYNMTPPTLYTTAGTGSNQLTTAPTQYYNVWPDLYEQNLCADTTLLLEGTDNPETTLGTAITALSDGYKATVVVSLESILAGAQARWRGVCLVMYTTEYVQETENGSLCVVATTGTTTNQGPDTFGANYLLHIPASIWAPPSKSASVVPAGFALTDSVYGIEHSPAGQVDHLYTQGYYSSTSWY